MNSSKRTKGRRVLRTPAVRPGPGSYRLLSWVARLGVAGLEPTRVALGLSQSVAYKHVARLADEELVTRAAAGDGNGSVIVVTRAGARVASEFGATGIVTPRSAMPSTIRHARAVSWVAALADLRGWEWLGPAHLRAEEGWMVPRGDGARHAPDLGVVHRGTRTAVEVELHSKAPNRVRTILRGYRDSIDRGRLTAVSYVVDRDEVARLIKREAANVGLGRQLAVGPLAAIVENTWARADERQGAKS